MKYKIYNFKGSDKRDLLGKALEIRNEVFIKEQNVPYSIDVDGKDEDCQHFLLMHGNKAIATSRLRTIGLMLKLERFAVLKDFRKLKIGALLLKEIIASLSVEERSLLCLNAQKAVIGFYEKESFVQKGAIFYEADIPHVFMYYAGK